MSAVDELRAARDLIANPERWTQGVYAKDAQGDEALPESGKAVCWCAHGAIMARGVPLSADQIRAQVHLNCAARGLFASRPDWVNDTGDHADVMAMYGHAIELAGAQS